MKQTKRWPWLVAMVAMALASSVLLNGCDDDDSDSDSDDETETTFDAPFVPAGECSSAADCVFANGAPTNACEEWTCQAGEDAVDDDGNTTPGTTMCVLVDAPVGVLCGDGGGAPCQQSTCDGAGACVNSAAFDGTPCGASDGCTGFLCLDGDCIANQPVNNCDDSNPCTDDSCTAGLCVNTPNTADCDDLDNCTENDTCTEGFCVGEEAEQCECVSTNDCPNDADMCNGEWVCDVDAGLCMVVEGSVVECAGELEVCEAATCDPATGSCLFGSAENGSECDDGDPCTDSDACTDGMCAGLPVTDAPSEDTTTKCSDGEDNDCDGDTDCDDSECAETDACAAEEEGGEEGGER